MYMYVCNSLHVHVHLIHVDVHVDHQVMDWIIGL